MQTTPCLSLPWKHSPDGTTSECGHRHSNCNLLLIYWPRNDKRLSWLCSTLQLNAERGLLRTLILHVMLCHVVIYTYKYCCNRLEFFGARRPPLITSAWVDAGVEWSERTEPNSRLQRLLLMTSGTAGARARLDCTDRHADLPRLSGAYTLYWRCLDRRDYEPNGTEHMHSADYAVVTCPSVCLSVRPSYVCTLSKRLNVSLHFFQHRGA